jgi:hypothetical protein
VATWCGNTFIADTRPRPALSALGDEIEAKFKANADRFPEIKESNFDQRS